MESLNGSISGLFARNIGADLPVRVILGDVEGGSREVVLF